MAVLLSGIAGPAFGADLTVIVHRVKSAKGGSVQVDLYKDPSTYRDIVLAGSGEGVYGGNVAADSGSVEIVIENIEPGIYALVGFHDENDDGKMNTLAFLPIPTEGFGAGNNAARSFGPPAFEASSIEIGTEDLTTSFGIAY